MKQSKTTKKVFQYVILTNLLSFQTRFPKSGPTDRGQVVNLRHQTPQGQSVAKKDESSTLPTLCVQQSKVDSPHKRPVIRNTFPCNDTLMGMKHAYIGALTGWKNETTNDKETKGLPIPPPPPRKGWFGDCDAICNLCHMALQEPYTCQHYGYWPFGHQDINLLNDTYSSLKEVTRTLHGRCCLFCHGPLARYIKLQVVHTPIRSTLPNRSRPMLLEIAITFRTTLFTGDGLGRRLLVWLSWAPEL